MAKNYQRAKELARAMSAEPLRASPVKSVLVPAPPVLPPGLDDSKSEGPPQVTNLTGTQTQTQTRVATSTTDQGGQGQGPPGRDGSDRPPPSGGGGASSSGGGGGAGGAPGRGPPGGGGGNDRGDSTGEN